MVQAAWCFSRLALETWLLACLPWEVLQLPMLQAWPQVGLAVLLQALPLLCLLGCAPQSQVQAVQAV
jgi:hypothetical protein